MSAYTLTLKQQAEHALVDARFDFIAKYHAVTDLRRLAQQTPAVLDRQTIDAVTTLLRSNRFGRIRQSYILYREAASVLSDMAGRPIGNGLGREALVSLSRVLRRIHGHAHRGAAEALGGLPVNVKGPRISGGKDTTPPRITWAELLRENGLTLNGTMRYIGRSLVAETVPEQRLLVVKLARRNDLAEDLENEIRWMERLRKPAYDVDRRFQIPRPLTVRRRAVFRLGRIPISPPDPISMHPESLAIAFVAPKAYFVYPNHHRVDGQTAGEMLGRNAYLMGWLAAKGVIHDAPIPLFHNRTQRLRRDDQGRYQWFRSGRLDHWLDSCAFPNLGLSGLRDFEHLAPFTGDSRQLYRHIGSHFLSLLLVAGSYFRCRNRSRKGLDGKGEPVDARDLFDRPLLTSMIEDIFENYYAGFTGLTPPAALPLDRDRLVDRMIEEMGVDRHMSELLRRADQQQMSERQFREFLSLKGFGEAALDGMTRGQKDILITSGPHLGDFNRQISLPELIEAVAAMAAVCMAGKYMAETGTDGGGAPSGASVTALPGPG